MGVRRKVVFLEEHLKRLKNSMEYLGIYREIDWYGIIGELMRFENITENEEFSVKIVVNDRQCMVVLKKIKLRDEPEGIRVKIIKDMFQNEFGFIKSTSYAQNILAMEKIRKDGYYEGIFKNRMGSITEGTISNVFFTKDDKLFTPSKNLNILNGIVREKIIKIALEEEIEVIQGEYNEEELINADSIFITNSLMKRGILWVNEIEGIKKHKSNIEKIVEEKYIKIIKN